MARTSKDSHHSHLSKDPAPCGGASSSALPAVAPASKIAQVLNMLQRPGGAPLAKLAEHTGWQPHTTRAALTGLRKKGHVIGKESREGVTVYRIVKAAS